jgi:hypothetical protein
MSAAAMQGVCQFIKIRLGGALATTADIGGASHVRVRTSHPVTVENFNRLSIAKRMAGSRFVPGTIVANLGVGKTAHQPQQAREP